MPVFDPFVTLAWPASDGKTPGTVSPTELRSALAGIHEYDAHFQAFMALEPALRLKTEALDRGLTVEMVALAVDVDDPVAHASRSSARADWRATEREKLGPVWAARPGFIYYETRGGYRLVWRLRERVALCSRADAQLWKRLYVRALDELRALGIHGDKACQDWTRAYRLPFVLREGKAQRPVILGDLAAGSWELDLCVPPEAKLRVVDELEDGENSPGDPALVQPLVSQIAELMRIRWQDDRQPWALAFFGWLDAKGWAREEREQLVYELAGTKEEKYLDTARRGSRNRVDGPSSAVRAVFGADFQRLDELVNAHPNAAAINARRLAERDAQRAAAIAPIGALVSQWRSEPPANDTPAEPEHPRGEIFYDESAEHSAIDLAIQALANGTRVFQRGGLLVHVARDLSPQRGVVRRKDSPRICEIEPAALRSELSRIAVWRQRVGKNYKDISVPQRVVDGILARNEWPGVRALRGISEFPIVRPDGSVVYREGYDAETGVFIAPSCEVEIPPGSPHELAQWVLYELFGDFPFASDAHRSALFAALLTPLARYAFDGPSPLVLIDKNVRGCGGSLAADLIGIVCLGFDLPRVSQAMSEEEEIKRLLGLAVSGDPIVLIDNVNQPLGNGALDRALTGTSLRDRWLGGNRIVTAPWNCMLLATGNNIQLVGDTTRRALQVRLESPEERPEERTGFRHESVKDWARANRGKLLGALVEVLASHLRSPAVRPRPWGSFEGWSSVVRGAVVGCGLADPYESRREIVAGDSDAEVCRALIDGLTLLGATSETSGLRVKEVLDRVRPLSLGNPDGAKFDALREALEVLDRKLEARGVGQALKRYKGRVIDGRKLENASDGHSKTARWFVAG